MSSSEISLDALVIGAGVVGLATGRALALDGNRVAVLEAGPRIGEQGSSRNSGIIHAGLYYRHDSLKARLCLAGREQLYRYCRDRGIAHRRCGKLVVAVTPRESEELEALHRHAEGNGVNDLEHLGGSSLKATEPWLAADSALWSPSSGILDTHDLLYALLGDLESAGGILALASRLSSIDCAGRQFRAEIVDGQGRHRIRAGAVINAAGLAAHQVARCCHGYSPVHIPEIRFARGNYFRLRGPAPTDKPVYPLPEPGGLGVHLTVDLAGQARFGPDVEWLDQPDFRVNEQRLDDFYRSVRRYWPALPDGSLAPDYAGVRPRVFSDDQPLDDFMLQGPGDHGIAGLVHLFGIESPGLTACLALADAVAAEL